MKKTKPHTYQMKKDGSLMWIVLENVDWKDIFYIIRNFLKKRTLTLYLEESAIVDLKEYLNTYYTKDSD